LQRLAALSSADTLIEAADGQGAILEDLIRAELGPHHTSNVSVAGPAVLLPPKLALVLALLFHELTTNAAKYGALSVPYGRVLISWTVLEGRLNMEWRELGGPAVKTPTHNGFGTQLLCRALKQFDGPIARLILQLSPAESNIEGKRSIPDPRSIQKTIPTTATRPELAARSGSQCRMKEAFRPIVGSASLVEALDVLVRTAAQQTEGEARAAASTQRVAMFSNISRCSMVLARSAQPMHARANAR
jgi:hypothetical protein